MIGRIKGKLAEIDGLAGLIETSGGVFYKLYLPADTISNGIIDNEIDLYTYLQVKDDDLVLYGFIDKKHLKVFQMLITVDGVGPKLGFNILNASNVDELNDAIMNNNLDYICSIPGVGKKTGQKIILELSSKMGKIYELPVNIVSQDDNMAVDALISLGFKKYEAQTLISKMDKTLSMEEKIKLGIKQMTKNKYD
jgi:Holliday junction DNA helicase RuvA